ncbi:hypothetical protein [Nannocystis sp.]|uniref:hypothetical protein n=1 Tax=Nannocystis sp. TaxID=1962667 RepID=UPI0024267978|nr:hypothetical protein [Nannocystis sp.]MBK7827083.1 hypothetical protein [Nannocystis sp.]MBK9755879.1 hypothetical protein [Nannocystis sp.]
MHTAVRTLVLLSLSHLLFACSGATNVDCKQVTVPKYAAMTAWARCTNCHSSSLSGGSRAGAPSGINYDSYDAAVADADIALSQVDSGSMPPSGSPKLSAAEKDQIINWASCDTPQ